MPSARKPKLDGAKARLVASVPTEASRGRKPKLDGAKARLDGAKAKLLASVSVAPVPARKPKLDGAKTRTAASVPTDPARARKADPVAPQISVRRMHRRDLKRVWEFLKLVFRAVNRETVEYQRPRSKQRFEEQYDDEGIEQLVFEIGGEIVGYAECAFEVTGDDNWINPRYFEKREMRPLFVEELASHPDHQGQGVGGFMLDQLHHLARLRGCTHLVLEVAENNRGALAFYRRRNFFRLDAAIFLAQKIANEPELLPPRTLTHGRRGKPGT